MLNRSENWKSTINTIWYQYKIWFDCSIFRSRFVRLSVLGSNWEQCYGRDSPTKAVDRARVPEATYREGPFNSQGGPGGARNARPFGRDCKIRRSHRMSFLRSSDASRHSRGAVVGPPCTPRYNISEVFERFEEVPEWGLMMPKRVRFPGDRFGKYSQHFILPKCIQILLHCQTIFLHLRCRNCNQAKNSRTVRVLVFFLGYLFGLDLSELCLLPYEILWARVFFSKSDLSGERGGGWGMGV